MSTRPFRILPEFHERVWGVRDLSPWFPDHHPAAPTGEAWFQTAGIPLLLKFLFTAEKLSVQVHPRDAYAAEHHQCAGKTEAWHVIAAEPAATVALGLKREMGRDEARAAFESGAIVDLLEWHPARAGDTFLVPAGTIHAIGGGLRIVEIQQFSDITYRLFDYGRRRELHLDHGLAVADLGPYRVENPAGGTVLADCDYFRLERLAGDRLHASPGARLMTVVSGEGTIDGTPFGPGHVWVIPAECAAELDASHCEILVCSTRGAA